MSLGQDASATRKAAIDQLKFKKKPQTVPIDQAMLPTSSSWAMNGPGHGVLPSQSRDATVPSRFFPATPSSPGTILVPNSSPPSADHAYRPHPPSWPQEPIDAGIPGFVHTPHGGQARIPTPLDPLSMSSGFTSNTHVPHASFTRPWGSHGRRMSDVEDGEDSERPRKRMNLGSSPPDPLNIIDMPDSPIVQRPGQRRRVNGTSLMSSASSDESSPDNKDVAAGPSRTRIVRGGRSSSPRPTSSSEPPQPEAEDARFTRFRLTQPEHLSETVRAAWKQAAGDVPTATNLLNDPSWKPPAATPPVRSGQLPTELGRVKEVDEASRAQRAAVREKGKKSMIYKTRPALDVKASPRPTPPASTKAPSNHVASPRSPASPIIQKRVKRSKRKVVDSDSEAEFVNNEDDVRNQKRVRESPDNELQALEYFNTTAAEALQELTGCTLAQANKIIELRPFSSVADLNKKLGQGKKKAGPDSISPRMFEDCATTFEGYGRVDSVLEMCEDIGVTLKAEIASWTSGGSGKGKRKEGTTSSQDSDIPDDGALHLSQSLNIDEKPSYYLTSQPSLLSKTVQLKEYQMIGINWLNLLYQKKLSCILADEMGLGKTVQVISFFAHLKEQGSKGPHLVVVPSSTLENWCREFDRFAPEISVEVYYAGKDTRPALRQTLNDTIRTNMEGGWEVLITTYNLAAQGDSADRKFFRRIDWNTCVFDEGHVLKNFQSQRYQSLLAVKSRWRLLLTGTPLQNNLQELVSLMNFIMPDIFVDELDALRAVFKTKGDSKVTLLAQERVSRAKKLMTPFVLRRRKDQVLKDLPKKTERIEWCEMTPMQRAIYNEALQRSRKTIFDVDATGTETPPEVPPTNGRGKAAKKTRATARTKDKMYLENSSNVLMDLRKAASHPMLFRRLYTDDNLGAIAKLLLKEADYKKRGATLQYVREDMEIMTDAELQVFCGTYKTLRKFRQDDDCYLQAGKVKVLLELLDRYQASGRRVLIFSQFTQILDILQRVLDQRQMKFLVLTGSTPVDVRQTIVDEFTEDESISVFLLSTKAGGMGINLTAASVVIMFDQDFNPHNDKQAQDRAYRIGQKQDVDVVKLITKGFDRGRHAGAGEDEARAGRGGRGRGG
ncbi:SNF2 family N-terminal domain-containing protein [Amylocystis lapponica]|nr:SNF2 family N-terminal domain-containing protein [Amylocystis lapponica]